MTVTSVQLGWKTYNGGALSNLGTIAGTGQLAIWNYGATPTATISFGVVNVGVWITEWAPAGSTTLTLTSNTTFGAGLVLDSNGDGANTVTLDLSVSNYALSANGVTVGAGGILNGRYSTITCSGNWDSSAGTFTEGTSTVIMSGTTKTIKTANTNGELYNLQVRGAVASLSSLNVTNNLTVDVSKTLTMGTEMR